MPYLSKKEVINRLFEWISDEVDKTKIESVLWAIEKADIDASVIKVVEKERKKYSELMKKRSR